MLGFLEIFEYIKQRIWIFKLFQFFYKLVQCSSILEDDFYLFIHFSFINLQSWPAHDREKDGNFLESGLEEFFSNQSLKVTCMWELSKYAFFFNRISKNNIFFSYLQVTHATFRDWVGRISSTRPICTKFLSRTKRVTLLNRRQKLLT